MQLPFSFDVRQRRNKGRIGVFSWPDRPCAKRCRGPCAIPQGCGNNPQRFPQKAIFMRCDYSTLAQTIAALTEGEDDAVSLMATVACEVHHADDRFDWTGFYRVVGPELLKIGPYQGGHGCLVIPFSRGVCGAAARTGQVQLVPDVDAFPGHIACATSTRSEIVLPVRNGKGDLIGVFDIDSNQPRAFDATDARELTAILDRVFAQV